MSEGHISGVFSAIQVLREEMGRGFDRIHARIDTQGQTTTQYFRQMEEKHAEHDREDAVKFATIEAKAEASKGAGKPAWLAIISAFGTAVAAYFANSKGH